MKPLPGPVAVPPVLAPLPAGCHLHSNKVLSVLSTGPLAPVWSLSLLPPGLFLDLDREVSGGHAPGPERPGNAHACGWGVGPVYTPWTQPPSPEHELSSLDVGVLKSSIYCPTFEHVPPRVLLGAKWEPPRRPRISRPTPRPVFRGRCSLRRFQQSPTPLWGSASRKSPRGSRGGRGAILVPAAGGAVCGG